MRQVVIEVFLAGDTRALFDVVSRCNRVQYSTAQYSVVRFSVVQYSTVQFRAGPTCFSYNDVVNFFESRSADGP